MEDRKVIEVLGKMLGRYTREQLRQTAVKDGAVYVSDGRIAWRYRPENPPADYVPVDYPVESIERYLSIESGKGPGEWFVLDMADVRSVDDAFVDAFRDECSADDSSYESRYVTLFCPCCGAKVYADTWHTRLVEERECRKATDPRDVEFSVQVVLGSKCANIAFSYLHVMDELGIENLEFCISRSSCGTVEELYVRSKDGRLHGVLMPLLVADGVVLRNTIHGKKAT